MLILSLLIHIVGLFLYVVMVTRRGPGLGPCRGVSLLLTTVAKRLRTFRRCTIVCVGVIGPPA